MADQLSRRRPRKDPRHIMLRVERATLASGEVVGALVPRHATDRRLMRERGYKVGDDLRAEITKPRILAQHRKAHLLGQLVVAQVEGFHLEDCHGAIKRLQRESGVCCDLLPMDASPIVEAILSAAQSLLGVAATKMLRSVLPDIKTIDVPVPQSLAFDRMPQDQFELFYRGICAHLCAEYWPNCQPDQVEQMAELFDRESAA